MDTGRKILFCIVSMSMLICFLGLPWAGKDGAMSQATKEEMLGHLMTVFLPMLGIMCAFLFAERKGAKKARSEPAQQHGLALACASVLTLFWSLWPVWCFVTSATAEDAWRLVEQIRLVETLVLGAITFYFAKR